MGREKKKRGRKFTVSFFEGGPALVVRLWAEGKLTQNLR